ncbi:DUF2255 family protein [Lactococcus taiwanensis]|uniref:DUF2255 family protein n=1 Tax=Lactococcus taiwanensis TaxID=1151742 RepID=UPI003D1244E0
MEIDVKKFSKLQDIYISPDPQEHRPAWIWFAYIDDDLAVAAGRGTASSWWNSAMLSRKGQIHIDGKVYQVEFEPVTDKENIDKFIASYRQRAGQSWDPTWEKNFRPTVMRLKFLKELGKSTR